MSSLQLCIPLKLFIFHCSRSPTVQLHAYTATVCQRASETFIDAFLGADKNLCSDKYKVVNHKKASNRLTGVKRKLFVSPFGWLHRIVHVCVIIKD